MGCGHHVFVYGQVRQQVVLLRNVSRTFSKRFQVAFDSVYMNSAFSSICPINAAT